MEVKYSFLYKLILSRRFFVSICTILPSIRFWPDNRQEIILFSSGVYLRF